MALYVRLFTSFWTNRKTIRLRAVIGEAALWLPLRLWSYAAENQPDGDFSSYSAEELAMLLGYSGNAQVMLEALQQASFLDGMRIHQWQEHNGYHAVFSDRASKAAKVRWAGKKKSPPVPPKEPENESENENEPSIASSIFPKSLDTKNFRDAWNDYLSYRKKCRLSKLQPCSVTAKLKKMAEWGESAAIQAIQTTIENGWQGVFRPKENGNGHQKPDNGPVGGLYGRVRDVTGGVG